MADAHKNFAVSAVATAPSPATSGPTLVITAGEGNARFAHAPPYNAVVCPANTDPTPANAEIVRVTGRTGDTFTITRAQEGSTARTIVAGDRFYAALTAKALTDVEAGVQQTGTAHPETTVTANAGTLYTKTGDQAQEFIKKGQSGNAYFWGEFAQVAYGIQVLFVDGVVGHDTRYDGCSWGSAFKTIQKAVDTMGSQQGIIHIKGATYVETVTIPANRTMHLKGMGQGSVGNGVRIKAPSAGADCVVCNAGSCTFEDITTQGFGTNWTGIGWNIGSGGTVPYTRLIRCGHANTDADTVNNTYGGTGLRITGSEALSVMHFLCYRTRVGMEFMGGTANGASVNYILDYKAQQVFDKVLLFSAGAFDQGGGGNTFVHCKSVGSGDLVTEGDVVVDLGTGPIFGGNTFIHCDWDENLTGVDVTSDNNLFISCTSAPSCAWTVSGDANHFIRHTVLGATLTVTGAENVFDDPHLVGGALIVDTGLDNRFLNVRVPANITPSGTTRLSNLASPRKYPSLKTVGVAGGAAARPATPAVWVSIQDPTTGQNVLVEGHLPPANPVLDSFIRADNASVIGTADSGQAWTSNVGQWGIISNQLYHAAANGDAVATLDAGIANGIVAFDYVVAAGSANTGPVWRFSDTANYWYIQGSGIKKNVAGSRSAVATLDITPVVGDHVRVILAGSRIQVEVNGRASADLTDTFNQTATKHGLYSNFDTAARWKNFRVTA